MKGGPGGFRATVVLHVHGMERAPDRPGTVAHNYPPYDLLRLRGPAGEGLRLVFAVAGFSPDRLEIRIAGDQLSVSGEGAGDGDPGRFLHRGIAARRFRRAFRLAPGLDVAAAELDRGLLSITLVSGGDRADRTVAVRTPSP